MISTVDSARSFRNVRSFLEKEEFLEVDDKDMYDISDDSDSSSIGSVRSFREEKGIIEKEEEIIDTNEVLVVNDKDMYDISDESELDISDSETGEKETVKNTPVYLSSPLLLNANLNQKSRKQHQEAPGLFMPKSIDNAYVDDKWVNFSGKKDRKSYIDPINSYHVDSHLKGAGNRTGVPIPRVHDLNGIDYNYSGNSKSINKYDNDRALSNAVESFYDISDSDGSDD